MKLGLSSLFPQNLAVIWLAITLLIWWPYETHVYPP